MLSIYFGENMAAQHQALARAIFRLFPVPFLRAKFGRAKNLGDRSIGPRDAGSASMACIFAAFAKAAK